jgi:hypothetical protein
MPYLSTPCRQLPLKQSYSCFKDGCPQGGRLVTVLYLLGNPTLYAYAWVYFDLWLCYFCVHSILPLITIISLQCFFFITIFSLEMCPFYIRKMVEKVTEKEREKVHIFCDRNGQKFLALRHKIIILTCGYNQYNSSVLSLR